MDVRRFQGKALDYILIGPDGFGPESGYPLVVLLHGFGASMYDLGGLAGAIDSTGYVFAFPNAPYQVDFGGAGTGFSWLLNREGVTPRADDSRTIDELMDEFLHGLMEELHIPAGDVVLSGFSQGGGLTLRYGLLHPETFKGLAALSASFRYADEVRDKLPADRSQPIFLVHGRHDSTISLERAHETKAFLEEQGYSPIYKEYDMGHEIPDSVVQDLIPWLHETLPPRPKQPASSAPS